MGLAVLGFVITTNECLGSTHQSKVHGKYRRGLASQDLVSPSGVSPEQFGSGSTSLANHGVGDKFGIGDRGTWLLVPENYLSGSSLSGSATWTGTTIASIGMTPGSYTWTWGSGAATDSLTLHIGVVPESSSIMLLGFGSAGLLAFYRKKPATPDKVAG